MLSALAALSCRLLSASAAASRTAHHIAFKLGAHLVFIPSLLSHPTLVSFLARARPLSSLPAMAVMAPARLPRAREPRVLLEQPQPLLLRPQVRKSRPSKAEGKTG